MKILSLIIAMLTGLPGMAATHGDHPSVHGMAVVGDEVVYLSHLPMFHSPHDYQVILEAEFDGETKRRYLESKANSGETLYTIAPETFVLPEMVANPKPFRARLFRGHFEREGSLLAENAEVRIKRVIYFRKFDPGQVKELKAVFLLFGHGKERFLAHEISAKPDFDQILRVKFAGETPGGDPTLPLVLVGQGNAPVTSPGLRRWKLPDGSREFTGAIKNLYLEEGDLSF